MTNGPVRLFEYHGLSGIQGSGLITAAVGRYGGRYIRNLLAGSAIPQTAANRARQSGTSSASAASTPVISAAAQRHIGDKGGKMLGPDHPLAAQVQVAVAGRPDCSGRVI